MVFKPPDRKCLQGAADARRRAHRRTFVLQAADNKADAVPCECLQKTGLPRIEYPEFKKVVIHSAALSSNGE